MKHYPRIILVPVTTILCIRLVSRVPDAEQYYKKSQTPATVPTNSSHLSGPLGIVKQRGGGTLSSGLACQPLF